MPLMLGDRAFDLLVLLARHSGEPVAASALQRALWQGRRVDPANLRMQVSALRRQLGRDAVQRTLRIAGLDDASLEQAIQGLVEHSMLQLLSVDPHEMPMRLRLAETTRR